MGDRWRRHPAAISPRHGDAARGGKASRSGAGQHPPSSDPCRDEACAAMRTRAVRGEASGRRRRAMAAAARAGVPAPARGRTGFRSPSGLERFSAVGSHLCGLDRTSRAAWGAMVGLRRVKAQFPEPITFLRPVAWRWPSFLSLLSSFENYYSEFCPKIYRI